MPPKHRLTSTFCPSVDVAVVAKRLEGNRSGHGDGGACSKLRSDGLIARPFSQAAAYSAKAPRHQPNTSSPGRIVSRRRRRLYLPATSVLGIPSLGCANPYMGAGRAMYGRPPMTPSRPG